jgi:hypothetical protein
MLLLHRSLTRPIGYLQGFTPPLKDRSRMARTCSIVLYVSQLAITIFTFVLLQLACPRVAEATEWQFIGSRYQGMGGAGVAVVDDSLAMYWNPGALAFAKGRDFQLALGAGVSAEGNVMSQIDELDALARDLGGIVDKVRTGVPLTTSDKGTLLQLVARDIPLFNEDDEAFMPRAHVGLTGRSGRFAFGVISDGNAVIAPFEDPLNLGLSSAPTAAGRVASFVGVGADRSAELSTAGQLLADAIADDFRAFTNTGFEQNQAEEYVFIAESAGLDTGNFRVDERLRLVAQTTVATNSSIISNNLTGAAAVTLITAETTLAYGHPFFEKIGVGGAIRYIYGNTFIDYTTVSEIDSVRELIKETIQFSNRQDGHQVGIDLGVLVKPLDWFRVGIVARNLNAPDFKVDLPAEFRAQLKEVNIKFDNVELSRQVRAGVAVDVFPWWTLAADIDLTSNDNEYVPGFDSRLLSVGTEVRLKYRKVALALRGGAFMNLAEDQNQAPTVTAGLGLRFWNFTLDFSGGVSTERDRFESIGTNDRIPVRVSFAAQLGYRVDF